MKNYLDLKNELLSFHPLESLNLIRVVIWYLELCYKDQKIVDIILKYENTGYPEDVIDLFKVSHLPAIHT